MSLLLLPLFLGVTQSQHSGGISAELVSGGISGRASGEVGGAFCYDCPGHGPGHSFPDCLRHVHYCHHHETCQVNYLGDAIHSIHCRPREDCAWEVQEGHQNHHCTKGGALVHHQAGCQKCCQDKDCLNDVLHPTAAPTTTPQPTKAPLWDVLKGECANQLDGGQCSTRYASKEACRDPESLRHCPETCGLCPLFGNLKGCHDIVLHHGCRDLDHSDDVCSQPMGVELCPVFCGKCHEQLQNHINYLLDQQQATTTPKETLAPSTQPTETLKPTTLAPQTPKPTTLGPETPESTTLAPEPTALAPETSQPTTLAPESTTQATETPEPTTLAPETPEPTTLAPVTRPPTTTPVPTTEEPVLEKCEDNLEVASCEDLLDVCSSPIFAQYCRKYCGFC